MTEPLAGFFIVALRRCARLREPYGPPKFGRRRFFCGFDRGWLVLDAPRKAAAGPRAKLTM